MEDSPDQEYADRLDDAAADATSKAANKAKRRQGPGRHNGVRFMTCGDCGALGGTRTPNLLIRSKIRNVRSHP